MTDPLEPTRKNPSVLIPVDPAIERYMRGLLNGSDDTTLTEMESYARERNFPIIERLVGVFIHAQAKMIDARRVFEFGSGYGYSAYWFARAVGPQGEVVCSDGDADNAAKAMRYLESAGLWERVRFHTGMAQDVFAETEGEFDICYNDVDKGDYPDIWRMARDRIRPGGLYIADNVLWHGRVAVPCCDDIVPGWTEAVMEHNRLIFDDPAFDAFINPTRDGVIVARRKIV